VGVCKNPAEQPRACRAFRGYGRSGTAARTFRLCKLDIHAFVVNDSPCCVDNLCNYVTVSFFIAVSENVYYLRDLAGAHRNRPPNNYYCNEQGVCLAERINPFPTKSDIPNIIQDRGTRSVGNAFMCSVNSCVTIHDFEILLYKFDCFGNARPHVNKHIGLRHLARGDCSQDLRSFACGEHEVFRAS
jgi:hypothetical protein